MIEKAKEKMRAEAAGLNSPIADMLSCQVNDNITSTDRAIKVLAEDKHLKDCKKLLDDYAKEHKKGNESCVPPNEAERLIIEYFGFETTATGQTSGIIDISSLL